MQIKEKDWNRIKTVLEDLDEGVKSKSELTRELRYVIEDVEMTAEDVAV